MSPTDPAESHRFFDLMHGIDHRIIGGLDHHGYRLSATPSWASEIMRDFTALGGTAFLTMLTAFVVVYLLTKRLHRQAIRILVTIIGGTLLSNGLKALFERPRPEGLSLESFVVTASFPSGHTMISTIVYLTLGLFIAGRESYRSTKIFIWCCAGLLPLMVGFSRVYLGVHWPTDVIAGWLAGGVWALLLWRIGGYICQQRNPALKEEA
ncbi:MAG TPA: phosphatase PAP2 family protein [Micavibrio sp.]